MKDIDGAELDGIPLTFHEMSDEARIAEDGATSESTGKNGVGVIALFAGSGYGEIGLCADGVPLRSVVMKSVDVAADTDSCAYATSGTTSVDVSDTLNATCGFAAMRGSVTIGYNHYWDLNCDDEIDDEDVFGWDLGQGDVGGWEQHAGHEGSLEAQSGCTGAFGQWKRARHPEVVSDQMDDETDGRSAAESRLFAILGPDRRLVVVPNPAQGRGPNIIYRARVGQRMLVDVYDVTGRRVRRLLEGPAKADISLVEWDGRDGNVSRVSSGIYFVNVRAASQNETQKIIFLR